MPLLLAAVKAGERARGDGRRREGEERRRGGKEEKREGGEERRGELEEEERRRRGGILASLFVRDRPLPLPKSFSSSPRTSFQLPTRS